MFFTWIDSCRNSAPAPCSGIMPIAFGAIADPGALDIMARARFDLAASFRVPEIPQAIDIVMFDQCLHQMIAIAGDDVDHASRQVRCIEDLIEVGGALSG